MTRLHNLIPMILRALVICYLAGLSWLGVSRASAQTATPPPMPVPQIQIDSIAYDEARNAFQVRLMLSNPGLLRQLRVKVENARSGIQVYERTDNVQSPLLIPVDTLESGSEYDLTITGLGPNGQPYTANVPTFSGRFETTIIQAQRRFTYAASAQPHIEIVSVDLLDDPPAFHVNLMQHDAQAISSYRAWLENSETGLRVPSDFVFSAPLNGPLIIPLEVVDTGRYHIVVNALDAGGAILAAATRQNVDFVRQQPSIFQRVEANPVLLGFVVVVALVLLLILLRITIFKPHPAEYRLRTNDVFRRSDPHLLTDDEKSLHRLDARRRQELMQKAGQQPALASAELVVLTTPLSPGNGGNRIVPIRHVPFTMGRENQDLSLPFQNVSRLHADITYEAGTYYITDRNSSNNTYINSQPIANQGPRPLQHGDEIRLAADVVLRFQTSANWADNA